MSADTIFALSSGKLPAGIAVIRLSGPSVRFALETICGFVPIVRRMQLSHFLDSNGDTIDTGLVVYFEGLASFTGEDCAEFHLHGGIAVVRAMLGRLGSISGLRAAEAGEFSKRAFMAGKFDLTQAEGLADLIAAETEAQRRLALYQSQGQLKTTYETWRTQLTTMRAMVEASIDFFDEDDVSERALQSLHTSLRVMEQEVSSHILRYRQGEIIKDGFRVVIAGLPNAGKSSLLNSLVKRDVAIASDEAGTTRDLIDVRLELNGNLVVMTDTAGLREAQTKVEAIGVERAKARIGTADLVLLVSDLTSGDQFVHDFGNTPCISVGTHKDLVTDNTSLTDFAISSTTGEGIQHLLDEVGRRASVAATSEMAIPTAERQVNILRLVLSQLELALQHNSDSPDLMAENLRIATDTLGRLVGRVDVEDLLDVIFSQFCIGK